jgi:preprotein translocase subunit SecA
MLSRLREAVIGALSHLELRTEAPVPMPQSPDGSIWQEQHDEMSALAEAEPEMAGAGALPAGPQPMRSASAAATIDPADPSTWGKVPRNAPCPCGSGKKYKHCHGAHG